VNAAKMIPAYRLIAAAMATGSIISLTKVSRKNIINHMTPNRAQIFLIVEMFIITTSS
jgi:hypothetical protein